MTRPLDHELEGLDPVALMETEAERIEQHFKRLGTEDWLQPSRCAGWSVRDVLAHLTASEAYHHACVEGRVAALFEEMSTRGATDVAAFNALGIADLEPVATGDLVSMWSGADAETRRGFRERGDGEVDTSIGPYPARWQAFHLAGELATHADDVFVAVTPVDHEIRRHWRTRFSRFALKEAKPELTVEVVGSGTRVASGGIDVVLSDDDLVEAVAGRANALGLDSSVRTLLSTMP